MKILLTRPAREAAASALRLKDMGIEAVIAPLFIIERLDQEGPAEACEALIATSLQAFDHLPAGIDRQKPLYVTGDRTKQAAEATGFNQVFSASGDAPSLVALIARHCPPEATLLYLSGADVSADLQALLPRHIIITRRLYAATRVDRPDEEALAALHSGTVAATLHYSRRAAEAFIALYGSGGAAVSHLCLSAKVADPLLRAGFRCRIARAPSEESLFELIPPCARGGG